MKALIFLLFSHIVLIAVSSQSSSLNVAAGKTAYASSLESSSFPASYAFDGNMATRWSSAYSDSQSLWVDLGIIFIIHHLA